MPSTASGGLLAEVEIVAKTLTLPDHLHSRLAAEAQAAGLSSIEEWLQSLAADLAGNNTKARLSAASHALDAFIGDWTAAEADDFDRAVAVFDQIDESLWK
jgi:hypothetical protein